MNIKYRLDAVRWLKSEETINYNRKTLFSDDGIQIDSIVAISNGGILVPHGICNFVIYRTANRKDAVWLARLVMASIGGSPMVAYLM